MSQPMRMTRRGLLAAPALALPAHAQAWPTRPIRVVVSYAPGGGTDLVTRSFAEAMRPILGQPLPVENRGGANGAVGSEAVARAEPDGYMLLVVTSGHVPLRFLVPSLPYHPLRDFTPVALLCRFPIYLLASVDAPFRDATGLLAHARAHPGALSYGTTTAAQSFAAQEFARQAGLVMTEVTYRGAGPMLPDVMAGHLAFAWASPESARAQMNSGRLRVIAVSSAAPAPQLPGVQSLAQAAGLQDYDHHSWYGLLAPAHLPATIRDRLSDAVMQAAASPALHARLEEQGLAGTAMPSAEFAAMMAREDAMWSRAAAQGLLRPAG